MTQFPEDDSEQNRPNQDDGDLTRFLRQHHPTVPPASPELEERILQAIVAQPAPPDQKVEEKVEERGRQRPRLLISAPWVVPLTLAAVAIVGIVSPRILLPPEPSAAELVNLEAFLQDNWQVVAGDVVAGDHDTTDLSFMELEGDTPTHSPLPSDSQTSG